MHRAIRIRSLALATLAGLLAAPHCPFGPSFDLDVAAFDVGPDGAILWTHVLVFHDETSVEVALQVATDVAFANVVHQETVQAPADADYTVQVLVGGLAPSTVYYYRFQSDALLPGTTVTSRVGRFRTAPPPEEHAALRFVISGDANLRVVGQLGSSFYVLEDALAQDPDFFVYFGDTIYADAGVLPDGGPAVTLDDYRLVHRGTRLDTSLRDLLASTGTFAGWDDHEVRNDYDGETVEPERFAVGAQAFFEYLPLRRPQEDPTRTYRRIAWGSDVELFFLDGRQYRSAEQFCNRISPDGPEADTLFSPFPEDEVLAESLLPPDLYQQVLPFFTPSDPDCVANVIGAPGRTLLGADQLAWLESALLDSTATWKIIVNDVPLSTLFFQPYDRWEGYPEERQALLDFIAQNLDPAHTLVLTTDFHTNLALRRPELTEVIVGPIGMETFESTVVGLLPPELADQAGNLIFFLNVLLASANGGPSSFLGAEHDAYSYALVEVFDEQGESRLRVTVRGDPDYAEGIADPSRVRTLFSFELP
jgi:phosphodiesterase/alkaline phosphatase D-like protein